MWLGGSPSIVELFPEKPPGMHRRTYGRLFNKAAAAQERDGARLHAPALSRCFARRERSRKV